MIFTILYPLYIFILLSAFGMAFHRRKDLERADKWIFVLLLTTLVTELLSEIATSVLQNNMYVYHVLSPIELFLICLYFNEKISELKRYNIGKIIGYTGFLVAIGNGILLQPFSTINSIFLLYEGFSVISLCLFAFFILVKKEQEILHNPHFWISTILLIYWSVVFVYWGMYSFLITSLKEYHDSITYSLWIVNILAYAGYTLIFMKYPKPVKVDG